MLKRKEKSRSMSLFEELDVIHASLQVQQANLHGMHWNVEGCPSFITIHKYLNKLYEKTLEHIDKIAEFSRIYGTYPMITFREYLDASETTPLTFAQSNKMDLLIEKAIMDSQVMLSLCKKFSGNTQSQQDINDYMALMIDDYGKRIWFLKASEPTKDIGTN